MAIALTLLEWAIPLLWLGTFLWLFNLISQHSVAFYATRARRTTELEDGKTRVLDRFEVRIFLQNLEDVPLRGMYELQVTLEPEVQFLSGPALFAGPIAFKEVQRPNMAWAIRFTELPAYDTWMIGFSTREASGVTVKLQEVIPAGNEMIHVQRTLRVLAADTIALPASARHARSGITTSPRWSTYITTCILSVVGYLILHAWKQVAVNDCAQVTGCYLRSFFSTVGYWDTILCICIFIAVSIAFFSGRRPAAPFAQGYLQPSTGCNSTKPVVAQPRIE